MCLLSSSAYAIQDKRPRITDCQPSSSTAQTLDCTVSPQSQPPTSELMMPTVNSTDPVRNDIDTLQLKSWAYQSKPSLLHGVQKVLACEYTSKTV